MNPTIPEMLDAAGEAAAPFVVDLTPDDKGCCRLHWSARKGSVDSLRAWKAAGGPMDPLDHDRNTPLHYTVWNRSKNNAAHVLLELGANPNAPNHRGDTPTHHAAAGFQIAVLKACLAAGGRWDLANHAGQTVLESFLGFRRTSINGGRGTWDSEMAALIVECCPMDLLDRLLPNGPGPLWETLRGAFGEAAETELRSHLSQLRLASALPGTGAQERSRARL